ncbi:SRPBCC family protein [Pilimelia anulata]|uniref:SRPBCC family protein n=1 Tax=Pilimelia anulata TaxID=53371 RepID=UPI001669A80C|nr:SRPBCC family protein [Pilimelia anulata]
MAITRRVIDAPAERVYAVLADGWTYSDWVVGTAHIRDVDPHWPGPGARIHHKAGPWPLSLRDTTVALSCEPGRQLVMRPRLWPFGEAMVTIRLHPHGDTATLVTIEEEFAAGPLHWVQTKLNDLALHQRNVESLRRLADIAERRRPTTATAATPSVAAPDAATAANPDKPAPGKSASGKSAPDRPARAERAVR